MKCIKNIRQKQKTTKNPGKGVLKGFKQVWYQPFLCAAVVFGLPGGATPLSTEFCIDISALPYRRWARRLKCAQNSPLAQTRMPSCKTRTPSCAEFKSPRSNPFKCHLHPSQPVGWIQGCDKCKKSQLSLGGLSISIWNVKLTRTGNEIQI